MHRPTFIRRCVALLSFMHTAIMIGVHRLGHAMMGLFEPSPMLTLDGNTGMVMNMTGRALPASLRHGMRHEAGTHRRAALRRI